MSFTKGNGCVITIKEEIPEENRCQWCSGSGFLFGLGEYGCPGCSGRRRQSTFAARVLSGIVSGPCPTNPKEWHALILSKEFEWWYADEGRHPEPTEQPFFPDLHQ